MTPIQLAQRVEAGLVGWRLNRLRNALQGPLAIITAGGLRSVAALWARLHEASGYPAWSITPYDFLDRSVPKGTSVLILSRGGRHHDVLGAVRHAHGIGCPVHAIVESAKAPLVSIVRNHSPDNEVVVLPGADHEEDPQLMCRAVPMTILAAALYDQSGPYSAAYSTRAPALPQFSAQQVISLGVGLAFPAALDFSIRVAEVGFAPCIATDPRNLSHAIARPYDPASTWFVFFCLPQHLKYAQRFAASLPEGTSTTLVTTTREGASGAIELMARGCLGSRTLDGRPDSRSDQDYRWVSDLYFLSVDSDT